MEVGNDEIYHLFAKLCLIHVLLFYKYGCKGTNFPANHQQQMTKVWWYDCG
jgi:hypothetical protein